MSIHLLCKQFNKREIISIMNKKVDLGLRIALGLMLVVFGANKFLNFMPAPEPTPELGAAFGALIGTAFILPTVAIVEVLVGLSLLSNKFTSLMLVVLVPISYSIVAFHLAFDPAGVGGAAFVAIVNVVLLLARKEHFKEVLKA